MARGFERQSRCTIIMGRVEKTPPPRIRGRHVIAGLIMGLVTVLLFGGFSRSVVAATEPDETPESPAIQTASPTPQPLPDMCVIHEVGNTCYVLDAESGCFPDCPVGMRVVNGPPPAIKKVTPARKRSATKRTKPKPSVRPAPAPKPATPSGPALPA